MKICYNCNKTINSYELICPYCQQVVFRKMFFVLIFTLLIVAGCGKDDLKSQEKNREYWQLDSNVIGPVHQPNFDQVRYRVVFELKKDSAVFTMYDYDVIRWQSLDYAVYKGDSVTYANRTYKINKTSTNLAMINKNIQEYYHKISNPKKP